MALIWQELATIDMADSSSRGLASDLQDLGRNLTVFQAKLVDANEEREMQKVSINIMHLSIFQYTFIKEINFYERVKRLIPAGMWLSTLDSPAKMYQSVKMEFVINHDFDVCAKITKKI